MAKRPSYKELNQRIKEVLKKAEGNYQHEEALDVVNGNMGWQGEEYSTEVRAIAESLEIESTRCELAEQDVVEHKQVEEKLLKSEAHLALTQRAARIGSWDIDLETGSLYWSDELYCIYGLKPQEREATLDMVWAPIHPEDKDHVGKAFEALENQGIPYNIEYRIILPNGDESVVNGVAEPVRDETGKIIRLYGTGQDITERKAAEELLKQESLLRNTLLDNLPCIALILKKGTREIVASNEAAREIGALPGKTCCGIFAQRDDPCPFCRAPELWATGESTRVEAEYRGTYYEGIWILLSEDLYVHYIFNITDRKRAEKEKIEREDQLRQAQKMDSMGTLTGGIAHDFNNILGIIVGNTEQVMRDIPEWNPVRHVLKEVFNAALQARELVRQILAFSGQAEADRKPVRVSPIIKESLKSISSSIPGNIEIRHNLSPHADTILADSEQINQILANLCANAAHAMREKGGILEVGLKSVDLDEQDAIGSEDRTPGKFLVLSVSDKGHGMAPDVIERIFDPYFTTKENGEGTGMGLSAVHGIVKGHGGTIHVGSEPGKGTTFSLFFPLIQDEMVPEAPPPEPPPLLTVTELLPMDNNEDLADPGQQGCEREFIEKIKKLCDESIQATGKVSFWFTQDMIQEDDFLQVFAELAINEEYGFMIRNHDGAYYLYFCTRKGEKRLFRRRNPNVIETEHVDSGPIDVEKVTDTDIQEWFEYAVYKFKKKYRPGILKLKAKMP